MHTARVLLSSALFLSVACTPSDDGQEGDGQGDFDGGAGDDGADGDGGGDGIELTVLPSPEIGTVFDVRWPVSDAGATAASVAFDPVAGGRSGVVDARRDGDEWTALVLGLKAGGSYDLRAREQRDGAWVDVGTAAVDAAGAPTMLPSLSVEHPGDSLVADAFLLTSVLVPPSTAFIVDGDGDYVWWARTPFDDHMVLRAVPTADGQGVLLLSQPGEDTPDADPAALIRVSWDGRDVELLDLPGGHHDLVQRAEGHVTYLAGNTQQHDGQTYVGDRLVELQPDGRLEELWNVWAHRLPDPDSTDADWTHANAVDYHPDDQRYWVGMRNLDAIVEIDPVTGVPIWQLGGEGSHFRMGEGAAFSGQHQFDRLSDTRLLVFDNGPVEEGSSRAIELELDWDAMTAELVREYRTDPPIYCFGPGGVQRLDNGNDLVVWGSSGLIDEVQPDGTLVWRLTGSLGAPVAYTTVLESLGAPAL